MAENDIDYENGVMESIRTATGLEIGCRIHWETSDTVLELSTVLPPTSLAPLFHGTQWAGTRLWKSAIAATRYIELHRNLIFNTTSSGDKKTILELGCGLGVPGMILHAQTGCATVLTDKGDLLEQLEKNIRSNFGDNVKIYARSLDWTAGGVDTLLKSLPAEIDKFDVVLNCDCIYEPLYGESWKALLVCQEELLRLNPCTVMITSCERRREDGVDLYLETAKASTVIREVEKLCTQELDFPEEIELYRLHGEQLSI